MDNFHKAMSQLNPTMQLELRDALHMLVESGLIPKILHNNLTQLVESRMDSEDEAALVNEVREARQTNRVLLQFNESVRLYLKGLPNA